MQMPKYIETKKDWEEMCQFLEEQDKDRLIDFVMTNITNEAFFKKVRAYFGTEAGGNLIADDLFKAYENEMMLEYESDTPDTDYIISFSQKFRNEAEKLEPPEKRKFLEKMAAFLEKGIEEYNVGFAEEDDFLVYDLVEEIRGEIQGEIQ